MTKGEKLARVYTGLAGNQGKVRPLYGRNKDE